jgi:hypothetical protein
MTEAELTPQDAAYQRLKETIRETYPQGWFVAIAQNRIVAASADFRELKGLVRAEGFDPRSVLIVEAGVSYPDFVDIFLGVFEQ